MSSEPLVASDRPLAGVFDVDVVMQRDGRYSVTIRVTGEVDLLTTRKLEDGIALALGDQPVVLVVATDRQTLRPLHLAGLDLSLDIYPTLRQAIEAT